MLRRASLAMLLLAGGVLFAASCSSKDDATPDKPRICTPGAFVFCKCRDLSLSGSKQCSEDGLTFSACEPCPADEDTGVDSTPPEDTTPPIDTFVDDTTVIIDDTGTDSAIPDVVADEGTDTSSTIGGCPGRVVAVDPGKDIVLTDDTSSGPVGTAAIAGSGACAVSTGSKTHVRQLLATASGKLTVKVTGGVGFDPTVFAREVDCGTGRQLACGETTGSGGTETLTFAVSTGKPIWLFVGGKAASSGTYTLTLRLEPGPFCGDGKVDTNEACDDGNKVAADGCGNACVPEGDPLEAGKCPGMPVHIWAGKTVTFSGSTESYALTNKSDLCVAGNNAPDRVFAVTAHKTGNLIVETTASNFNHILYVRKSPCGTGAEIVCANDVGGATGGNEKITFPVTDGQTYYVYVDGALAYRGTFTLKFSGL